MNKRSVSIPLPVLGAIVAIALFATGLNASSLLPAQPPSDPASYSLQPARQNILMSPVGTDFTYQGSLTDGGSSANGSYDFQFNLYDALTGGTLVSGPVARPNVTVTNGLFTVILDFGADAFNGDARYLEIEVRQSGGGLYITLTPRQEITPAPYALFALKTAPYKNVVVVAQSGGQFTSIQAALNSITDATTTNRYLVKVAPGTYTEQVTMQQYIDIEGSGEGVTKITSTGNPTSIFEGTLLGAANTELRSLTVENTGGNSYAVAIYLPADTSLLHVTAKASGAITTNIAVHTANSSPSLNNLTAVASGSATESYGVFNDAASPRIVASNITASGASITQGVVSRTSGTVTIDNSKITAPTPIHLFSGVTVRVGASQLSGGPVSSAGTITCSASYDENYVSPGLNVCP